MRYAICFDFPSKPGEPMFARIGWGWNQLTEKLADATRFHSEEAAEEFLEFQYGPNVRACGAVVEMA